MGLLPDQLFSLTFPEYSDMVNSKLTHLAIEEDKEMERLAWQSSLLMSATGNYGKKGIEPKKLYTRLFDDMGNYVDPESGVFKPIDREEKDNKLNELIEQFNKG